MIEKRFLCSRKKKFNEKLYTLRREIQLGDKSVDPFLRVQTHITNTFVILLVFLNLTPMKCAIN